MHRPARVAAMAAPLAVLAASQCLLWTGPAAAAESAGSVQVIGSTVYYTAEPGVVNDVDVSPNGLKIDIDDLAGPIDIGLGAPCAPSPMFGHPYKVSCDRAGLVTVVVDGGDLGDTLYVRDPMSAHLYGGPGDDSLTGGPGADLLIGAEGADEMAGGIGFDTVSYAGYAVAVVADADGSLGDDGAPGEGDTIYADVEQLIGGIGADLLMGTSGDDVLRGGPGGDRVLGYAGDDRLYGDAGYDSLDGGGAPSGVRDRDVCSLGQGSAATQGCEVVLD